MTELEQVRAVRTDNQALPSKLAENKRRVGCMYTSMMIDMDDTDSDGEDFSKEGLLEFHARLGSFMTYDIVVWEQVQDMGPHSYGECNCVCGCPLP